MNIDKYRSLSKGSLAALILSPVISSGVVIFSEDFEGADGGIGSLNGTMEDTTGAVWSTNGFATDNGVLQTGQFEGSALLGFTPTVGNVYDLSLDVTGSDRWIGLGFSQSASTNEANNAPPNRLAQNGGVSWFLFRPATADLAQQVEIFGGPNTTPEAIITDDGTDFSSTVGAVTLQVILDTTADATGASFTADFLIDGNSVSSGPQTINVDISTIQSAGFSFEGPVNATTTSPITVDNFELSNTSIPEPSTADLVITEIVRNTNNDVELTWNSVEDRSYRLETSTGLNSEDPVDGWIEVEGVDLTPSAGATTTFTLEAAIFAALNSESRLFFRIVEEENDDDVVVIVEE